MGESAGTLGTNSEEPITTLLLDNEDATLTLDHYNTGPDTATESIFSKSQFHGDLYVTVKSGRNEISTQVFGFCIQYAGSTRWDCLQAMANVVPSKIAEDPSYNSNVDMVDLYYLGEDVPKATTASPELFLTDKDWFVTKDDNSKSWRNIKSKTYKKCILDEAASAQPKDSVNWKIVECEKINAHFYRDFVTEGGDDIMLDLHSDTKYEVIGFQRDHGKADFSDPSAYQWGDVITDFQPVS